MKAALLLAALGLAACSAPGSTVGSLPAGAIGAPRDANDILGSPPAKYPMQVALFDAPLTGFQNVKVNIGILGVQLLQSSGAVPFVTNPKADVVNLLELQSHSEDFNGQAPGGQYAGVRMLIDPTSSNVTIGNFRLPIVWGSPGNPTTSPVVAVDFPCSFTLSAANQLLGGTAKVTLDFNVMQSVRFVNGTIYVQPSVTAASMAAQLRGVVRNQAGKAVSNATVLALDASGRVVNSTVTLNDGSFALHALPPGLYAITVKNQYVTSAGETITAVNADAGAAPTAYVILSPQDNVNLGALTD